VLRFAVGVKTDKHTKPNKSRVSQILRKAGFNQGKFGQRPQRWCWQNPDTPSTPARNDLPSGEVLEDEAMQEAARVG
jgi:hypothetical protein